MNPVELDDVGWCTYCSDVHCWRRENKVGSIGASRKQTDEAVYLQEWS